MAVPRRLALMLNERIALAEEKARLEQHVQALRETVRDLLLVVEQQRGQMDKMAARLIAQQQPAAPTTVETVTPADEPDALAQRLARLRATRDAVRRGNNGGDAERPGEGAQ